MLIWSAVNFAKNYIYTLYNKCFPVKTRPISKTREMALWLTNNLIKSIDRKHRLFRLSRANHYYLNQYRAYRNGLCRTIADAEGHYFTNKFDNCQRDIRATWRSINSMLKPNYNKGTCPILRVNNGVISGAGEVAECFNNYFVNIGDELNQVVSTGDANLLSFVVRHRNSFVYFPTDARDLFLIVSSCISTGAIYKPFQTLSVRRSFV